MTKGQQEVAFFSLPEYERWRASVDNSNTWRTKYYKGLGTSTAKEAKEYFSDMDKHRIPFTYGGPDDDDAILLVRGEERRGSCRADGVCERGGGGGGGGGSACVEWLMREYVCEEADGESLCGEADGESVC